VRCPGSDAEDRVQYVIRRRQDLLLSFDKFGVAGAPIGTAAVPGANSPTGSSPDFSTGPIIPNAVFPLTINGGTYTNGVLNDSLAQFQVPAIDQVPGSGAGWA
jgi:hypothetical protein